MSIVNKVFLLTISNLIYIIKVQYCLYRSTLKVDLSETVKFTFIYNLGEKVSFFKKGRFGIVKGGNFNKTIFIKIKFNNKIK